MKAGQQGQYRQGYSLEARAAPHMPHGHAGACQSNGMALGLLGAGWGGRPACWQGLPTKIAMPEEMRLLQTKAVSKHVECLYAPSWVGGSRHIGRLRVARKTHHIL